MRFAFTLILCIFETVQSSTCITYHARAIIDNFITFSFNWYKVLFGYDENRSICVVYMRILVVTRDFDSQDFITLKEQTEHALSRKWRGEQNLRT